MPATTGFPEYARNGFLRPHYAVTDLRVTATFSPVIV
jgi:hypothetical protein